MRALLSFIFIFSFNVWGAELKLPALNSPVMDLAGLMNESDKADLAELAYEINANNGPQITILTVPDMQGYEIEDYAIRVAEKWQLGTKEKDNGLLVVIAVQERAMRIEVGNGIEGEITDYDTARYTQKIFPEYFRSGNFHDGLRIFMQDVAKIFNVQLNQGNRYVTRAAPPTKMGGQGNLILIGIIVILIIGSALFKGKPMARGLFTGIGFSGMSFMFGIPLMMMIIIFIVGLVLGMMGIGNFLFMMAMNSGRGGRGGFGGGGFGGGGGWGGGGGGFSGGGSSGRW